MLVLFTECTGEMGDALEADHLGNRLEIQLGILHQGLGLAQPLLYQIFEHGGAIKLPKTVFQLELIGAQLMGQIL